MNDPNCKRCKGTGTYTEYEGVLRGDATLTCRCEKPKRNLVKELRDQYRLDQPLSGGQMLSAAARIEELENLVREMSGHMGEVWKHTNDTWIGTGEAKKLMDESEAILSKVEELCS